MKLKIVTVATHSERYFPLLVQSCEKFGLELVVLGWNSKWTGFTYKFDLMREFLAHEEPDTIIVFVDAYDVVMLQPATVILDAFARSGANILVAKDWNLMWYHEYAARFGFGMCQRTRLNSGTYMGRASNLIKMFDLMCGQNSGCKDHKMDDQVMITDYCNRYPDMVKVDTDLQLFIAVSSEKNSVLDMDKANLSIQNKQLIYDQQVKPCIIHVPFNTRIDEMLESLGFDTSVIKDEEFKGEKMRNVYIATAVAIILVLLLLVVNKNG